MRNTHPNRSSYATLPSRIAAVVSGSERADAACSNADDDAARLVSAARCPMRGCSDRAAITSGHVHASAAALAALLSSATEP
jgi:hypothetical protein